MLHYRNIRVKSLPDTAIDAAKVAIANRGYRSIYSGLDLDGWRASVPGYWYSKDWILQFDGPDGNNGSLTTDELFGNVSFVCDVRLLAQDSNAQIQLRNGSQAIDTERKEIADALQKRGAWNRFEGKLENGKLDLMVNGKTVLRSESISGESSGLCLVPRGKVEFANIFVK